MADDKKAYAALACEYSSLAFRLGNTAIFSTSTCSGTPVCRPIINHPTEITELLYLLIGNYCRDELAAIATGKSTCRNRKDVIGSAMDRFGRGWRTIEKAISATIPSTAAT